MPKKLSWDARFTTGHDSIDAQHHSLVDASNRLAEHALPVTEESNQAFQREYDALMTLARQHFATEEALLASQTGSDIENYRHACEEFEFLAAEIATTENFDKLELQRFLALWLVGHMLGNLKEISGK